MSVASHDARLSYPQWSPDGSGFLFTNMTEESVDLWVCDAQTAHALKLDVPLNAAFGTPAVWLDPSTLFVHLIPKQPGESSRAPLTSIGPLVHESSHKHEAIGVHPNLICCAHDEDLFDHYASDGGKPVGS